MSGSYLDDSLWLLSRANGASRAVRLIIVLAPVLATINTSLAAGSPFLVSSAVIVIVAVSCAIVPDTHIGLIAIVMIATEWVVRVDDPLTPWSIGLAGLIGVFHLAMAIAGTAPAGADLDRSTYRPWLRRVVPSLGVPIAVWTAIVALDRANLGRQAGLVAAALMALSFAAYWATSKRPPVATP